jgi:hypothetical protein
MAKITAVHVPAQPRNIIINGNLDYWQRVIGATTTINTAAPSTNYTADRFGNSGAGPTNKNYSIVRSTDVPSLAQSGNQSAYSYLYTQLTGISMAAADYIAPIQYRVEGFDYAKIHGKKATFGFWFKASIAGTYSFALQNGTFDRNYMTTFTHNSADTWEFKSITVQMDTSGTWALDNTMGLGIVIGGCGGSTLQTANVNGWQSGSYIQATGSTNWMATTNANIRIAQFSLVEGSLGLGPTGFMRAGETIQDELAMCQRYYAKSYAPEVAVGAITDNGTYHFIPQRTDFAAPFGVQRQMRTNPSIGLYSDVTGAGPAIIRRQDGTPSDVVMNSSASGANGHFYIAGVLVVGNHYSFHFTANAEL